MNSKRWIALTIASLLLLPALASAEVPAEIPIQAYLTDDTGVPVDGTVTIGFSIYDAATGGTELHFEEHTVDAEAGALTAYLVPELAIFEEQTELYIGISVDSGEEMSPRLKLATVPYAAVAGSAATLQGRSADDFASADYAPSWEDITDIPDELGSTYTAGVGLDLFGEEFVADFSAVQQRVTGSCPAGEFVMGINEDGTVMCGVDMNTDTTYTAGFGLDLGDGVEFEVETDLIQQRVTGTCSQGEAIIGINEDGTVMCGDGGGTTYTAGTGLQLNNDEFSVRNGGIGSAQIASGAVSNSHISNSAGISPSKISGTAATLNSSPNFSGTVTANNFQYTGSRARYLPLPSSAFQPNNAENWRISILGGQYGYTPTSSINYLAAPIQIPNGGTITSLNCYAYDNHSSENLSVRVRLTRSNIWVSEDGNFTTLGQGTIDTSGQSTNLQLVAISGIGETVDSDRNVYQVNIRYNGTGSSLHRFHGCKVRYTVDSPAP